jgi:lipopolysaccharide/colanic/teichoic acid biosynthesis glycosyltransferase
MQTTDDDQAATPGRHLHRAYPGKRGLDLLVVVITALPVIIASAACGLAIRLTSRGPIIFRQERVGRDGRPFTMLKFRTMRHDTLSNPVVPDEHRITAIGRLLRRLSLDELPQFLNVVRGDMSVVGPRPTLQYQVERYDQRQRERLAVRPGLTGLAQIRGRNRLSWTERIELDLDYLQRQSGSLDLKIIAGTVPALISGAGVTGHSRNDTLSRPEEP